MAQLRQLGIQGRNLPTRRNLTVQASDFSIGGFIGRFERSFRRAFLVNDVDEKEEIFGGNINSAYYGSDAVEGFFANLAGTDGRCYIYSHVGYDGSAFDAVTATATVEDQAGTPEDTIRIDDAYQGELGYGTSGNRTGYTITNGTRFSTTAAATAVSAATSIQLNSVIDIQVGDIIRIDLTGVAPVTVHKKVTEVNESTGTVSFEGALHGSSTLAIGDAVSVPGFQLKLFRRSVNGIQTEVESDLGLIWCTMEPEVTDNYVVNVFSASNWVTITDLSSTSVLQESFPADTSSTTFLAGGANGTTPTTEAHWSQDYAAFNDLPIRFLTNPEATLEAVNKAGETYAKSRWDNPIWLYTLPEDRSKAQLITIGNSYQRTDDVIGVATANWLQISDPFANAPQAPARNVPNVGHIMGAWIRSLNNNGIHYVPARQNNALVGVLGVVGDTFLDDQDRTDIANAGINVIQNVAGVGVYVKNFFTPSTTTEFQFGNGILMRNFFKVSFVDSLTETVNEPNSLDRIQASADAITNFYYRMYTTGSTGNVPEGETFGRGTLADGTPEQFTDLVQIQADIINNPQSAINLGERNLDSWFSYPAPAGRIRIGVGFILRS